MYIDRVHYRSFVQVPLCVLIDGRLSATEKAVYMAVLSFINKSGGGTCWAAAARIATRAGVRRTALFAALAHLEDLGYIERRHRKGQTDEIAAVPLPVNDFRRCGSSFGGLVVDTWDSLCKVYSQIVDKFRTGDYLSYDKQSRVVRFTNTAETADEHKTEVLKNIIVEYSRRYPYLPLGVKTRKDFLILSDNSQLLENITDETLQKIFFYVENSPYFKTSGKTLKWLLEKIELLSSLDDIHECNGNIY